MKKKLIQFQLDYQQKGPRKNNQNYYKNTFTIIKLHTLCVLTQVKLRSC